MTTVPSVGGSSITVMVVSVVVGAVLGAPNWLNNKSKGKAPRVATISPVAIDVD
jgi:hypothetical protein